VSFISGALWTTRFVPGQMRLRSGAMPSEQGNDDVYIDANGCLTERFRVGDQQIVVHYDDIPESDITLVRGLRCTTPIRTVIDVAPEMRSKDLERMIRDGLDRGLFTVDEALERINQPDMAARVGARMVRSALARIDPA
jgi:hypothetical protein